MALIKNGRTVPSDGLSAHERIVQAQAFNEFYALQAVAKGNGRYSGACFLERAHDNALKRLEQKGIITRDEDGFYAVVPGRVVQGERGWYTVVDEIQEGR
jgi:hypothetical protein